ncbi:hypothetical protein HJC23_005148 [Cyclotella cryptica]|uniref:MgtC/SapB/SrpB/YhiD N-terminal domain-containing protein n=1 Tax=Cyclotella cryptica TaxID=29204 RepID=A0ABD3QFZ7_9STRA
MHSFFSEFTYWKGAFYGSMAIYVLSAAAAVMIEPHLTLPCDEPVYDLSFPNAFYVHDPCRFNTRYWRLMGLKPVECIFGRHLVAAVILGSIIGYERRGPDRPAGIRTMAVIALASCLFTINSIFVFEVGPMSWDPARVSAAIPSGVGFLGAGLIVKDTKKDIEGELIHTIKGINTAASVWLSAAVGAACGGGLYFVASFTTALMLVLLRFGPRSMSSSESIVLPFQIDETLRGKKPPKALMSFNFD